MRCNTILKTCYFHVVFCFKNTLYAYYRLNARKLMAAVVYGKLSMTIVILSTLPISIYYNVYLTGHLATRLLTNVPVLNRTRVTLSQVLPMFIFRTISDSTLTLQVALSNIMLWLCTTTTHIG